MKTLGQEKLLWNCSRYVIFYLYIFIQHSIMLKKILYAKLSRPSRSLKFSSLPALFQYSTNLFLYLGFLLYSITLNIQLISTCKKINSKPIGLKKQNYFNGKCNWIIFKVTDESSQIAITKLTIHQTVHYLFLNSNKNFHTVNTWEDTEEKKL